MVAEAPTGHIQADRESTLEFWARLIVGAICGVEVDHNDDGSSDAMPDAVMKLTAGPAPLETVGDWDVAYERQRNALRSHGRRIKIDPDEPAWFVTVEHRASVKVLSKRLPKLLHDHQGALLQDWIPDELSRLGVEHARRRDGKFGHIHLSSTGWVSWDETDSFTEWLDGFIVDAEDVPKKLEAFGGAEQHMFIWLTSPKSWAANEQLEGDEDHPFPQLPADTPSVPANVTDLWIASTLVRPLRGVLRWNRSSGWSGERFDFESLPRASGS